MPGIIFLGVRHIQTACYAWSDLIVSTFTFFDIVTGDIKAHQVPLNRVPEQATEDSV